MMVVVTPTQVWGYEAEGPPRSRPPQPPVDPRAAFQAMIDSAEADLAAGNTIQARAALLAAARGDAPPDCRAWAAARLLLLTPPTDDFVKLPDDLRAVLDPDLFREWLLTPDGQFASLGMLVDRHVGRAEQSQLPPGPPKLPSDSPLGALSGLSRRPGVERFVRLPPGTFSLAPIVGAGRQRHLFVAGVRELAAFPLAAGVESRHAAAGVYTHAADLGDGFVAAGPDAVAVYGPDREPAWVFRVPETDPLPARAGSRAVRGGEPAPLLHLSSFALAGTRLFARLGDRHLIALDLHGRTVAWVLGTDGRRGFERRQFEFDPRFEPHFLVAGQQLLIQRSDGCRWMIDAATGEVQSLRGESGRDGSPGEPGQPTALVPWASPPVKVGGGRIAVADGPGLVRLMSPGTGRSRWTYTAGGESSLSGEPPQVRLRGDALLVAVRRTFGVEVDRIDPFDGQSLWAGGPVFVDSSRLDADSIDADSQHIYIASGGKLAARSAADASLVWEADLPRCDRTIPWVVRAGLRVVIAYPSQAIPAEPPAAVFDRAVDSFARLPLLWRLPWLAEGVYHSWNDRTLPVLVLDPATGEVLSRIAIPARGPTVTARLDGDHAVLATGDRVAWLR
jgi:hypothetical protein